MAKNKTRTDLKNYSLRKLGEPVIKVNVEETQLQDRIDDAITKFNEEHYDGSSVEYLVYTITQTDIDNKYVILNNNIQAVLSLIDISNTSQHDRSLFDVRYQMRIEDAMNWKQLDLTGYAIRNEYLSTLNMLFSEDTSIRFTRHSNKLQINVDWNSLTADVTTIAIEANVLVSDIEIYDDTWLKKYTTALIKKQWGENMKKMSGVQLLGGMQLNGQEIWQEASDEIEKLEEELEAKYTEPVNFFIG